MMKRFISHNWFPPLILFFFLALTFYRLPQTFFQQDEWRGFGIFAIFEENYKEGLKMLLPKTFFEHFAIGSFLIEYLQFKFFRINFFPFAIVSLSLHFLTSLLVYRLTFLLSNKKFLSLAVAVLFITNSISHQATTWISTSTSTQAATFFTLISLILFFEYLKNKQAKIKFLFFSLISFFISLTFKENSIFLFLFLPIFWFIFIEKKTLSGFKKIIPFLFLALLFYMLLRGLFLFNNFNTESVGFRMDSKDENFQTTTSTYIYRVADLPFKALPQSIFTTTFLMNLSDRLIHVAYPHWLVRSDGTANPYVLESIAFDYISFILSVIILLFTFLVYKLLHKSQDEKLIKLLIFSLVLIIIGYLPFIFIPGRGGFISIAEPRNLYIPGVGASIFLTLSVITFSLWIGKKIKLKNYLPLAMLLILLLVSLHIKNIWRDLEALQERSQIRLGILKTISASYPVLPEKIVLYTQSDTAYYGLPDEEKILPFQSGFGRTLLVWYYGNGEKIPTCFLKNDWLYHQSQDEGYKECQNRGFGYFRKFESLKKSLEENNLSAENVVAFSWDSKKKEFKEITAIFRLLILGFDH